MTAVKGGGASPAAPAGYRVVVDKDVEMTTRDGTVLRSDVYRPDDDGRHPVLLGRTCYGKSTWGRWIDPERTAGEGYAVVFNDMRGGFASDGEFDLFRHDGPDGHDVVEWCAAQPWSDGRVGMFGSSAPGFAQLLAAAERPPHLVAIAPMQTWSSFGRGCVYDPGGAYLLYTHQWMLMLAAMDPERRLAADRPGYEERRERVERANWNPGAWFAGLPLDAFEPLPRDLAPAFHGWLAHADHDDFWAPMDVARRYGDIAVPALHLVGWFDKFRVGSTHNYAALRDGAATPEARAGQRLVLGPWTHGIPVRALGSEEWFGADSALDVRALVLRWYDHWLRGADNGVMEEPRVSTFVLGANRWRDEADWPPPGTQLQTWHLRERGALTRGGPGAEEPPDDYVHDPADPVPTAPGRMSRPEGPVDVAPLHERADVLVYRSAPLEEDLRVAGAPAVRLWAQTSAADADWVVSLVALEPSGRARRLTEGMLRARYREGQERAVPVPPGVPVEYVVELRPTDAVLAAGHRLCVDVASSSFPQYERNLGRGVVLDGDLEGAVARQRVFHDTARPSALDLPVAPW